jgi:hypothetical protein
MIKKYRNYYSFQNECWKRLPEAGAQIEFE